MERTGRGHERRSRSAGSSLVEVTVASALLMMASVSLAAASGTTSLASKSADQALAVRASLETASSVLEEQAYAQLLALDGSAFPRNGHTVTVSANLVAVGLILIELVVTNDTTGQVLARLATYRGDQG